MISWEELPDLDAVALLNTLSAYLDQSQAPKELDDMPVGLQTLWLLQDLEFELVQGSLLAYFTNSSGRNAAAASDALRRIGALRSAETLDRARQLAAAFPAPPGDVKEYAVGQPYRELPNAAEVCGALTDELRSSLDAEDFGDLLAAYLHRQAGAIAAFGQRTGRLGSSRSV